MQERFYIQLFECNVKQGYVTVLNNRLGQVNERDILRPILHQHSILLENNDNDFI